MINRNRLKYYRKKNGLTQQELADYLKIRLETISRIERGRHNPSFPLAMKISQALNTKVEKIFCIKPVKRNL